MLPTSLPGGMPGGDHRGPADLASRRQRVEGGDRCDLERRAAVQRVERLVRTAVGNADDVLHLADHARKTVERLLPNLAGSQRACAHRPHAFTRDHASVIAPFSAPCARRAYLASTPEV